MAEESNPEAPQELPDYLQKYFTDRPRPQHPLDLNKLPATREMLVNKILPQDMEWFAALAMEIATQIELDLKNGHGLPASEADELDATLGPGAVLQTYVFALH
jgi:hypothetical protein